MAIARLRLSQPDRRTTLAHAIDNTPCRIMIAFSSYSDHAQVQPIKVLTTLVRLD
jgi:hypothetical protein